MKLRSEQRKEAAIEKLNQYNKIMQASSEDDQLFYSIIRTHRKTVVKNAELLVNGVLLVRPVDIRSEWADHFEGLATPHQHPAFDHSFKNEIDDGVQTIQDIIRLMPDTDDNPISHDEVSAAISRLNKKKAADLEELCAEHIIHGKDQLTPCLAALFNSIITCSYVPPAFKKGMVIPVPKKGKDARVTDNYRGITITSIIGKVLEHVVQRRLRAQVDQEQSKLQRGFTEGASSANAALLVSEIISEAEDAKKELFVASLDARKAFDVVYQNAMLHKLYYYGLHSSLWRLLFELYQDASSQVKWDGTLSRAFNLSQGVRQGSVVSTDCYKIFINGLLKTLESSRIGTKIGDIYVGAPTCADDVLLAAESMTDLQFMLQVAANYASEHRYIIHPEKSTVMIYNSQTPLKVWQESKPFKLGNDPLNVSTECTHLGLLRSTTKNQAQLIDARMQLARRTTYSLMGAGLHGNNGVHPLLSAKMLSTFVIPRYIHGLETTIIRQSDLSKLDKYHKGVLKKIQHLPDRTADEAVFLLLGQLPIVGVISKRRLTMFGAIARGCSIEKEVAQRQLAVKDHKSSSWFVKANAELTKYGLPDGHSILVDPPPKARWKESVNSAVDSFWLNKLRDGAASKSSLKYINWDFYSTMAPHHVWSTASPDVMDTQRAAIKARLLTGTYTLQEMKAKYYPGTEATCQLCKTEPESMGHFLLSCKCLEQTREYHMQHLRQAVIAEYSSSTWNDIVGDEGTLMQLILDCTKSGTLPYPPDNKSLEAIESVTRRLCFALHRMRKFIIGD